jgi:hypothetical protein
LNGTSISFSYVIHKKEVAEKQSKQYLKHVHQVDRQYQTKTNQIHTLVLSKSKKKNFGERKHISSFEKKIK